MASSITLSQNRCSSFTYGLGMTKSQRPVCPMLPLLFMLNWGQARCYAEPLAPLMIKKSVRRAGETRVTVRLSFLFYCLLVSTHSSSLSYCVSSLFLYPPFFLTLLHTTSLSLFLSRPKLPCSACDKLTTGRAGTKKALRFLPWTSFPAHTCSREHIHQAHTYPRAASSKGVAMETSPGWERREAKRWMV